MIFYRLWNYMGGTWLNTSYEYIQTAVKSCPGEDPYSSFFFGNTGVWSIAAAIEQSLGLTDDMNQHLDMLKEAFGDVVIGIQNGDSKSPIHFYDLTDIPLNPSCFLFCSKRCGGCARVEENSRYVDSRFCCWLTLGLRGENC